MKLYISYLLTAFFNFWIISFYLGFSVGFASYVPIIALFGSILLFVVASPILIYFIRIGAFIGFLSSVIIIPYGIIIIKGIFEDNVFNWGILLLIPFVLTIISIYLSIQYLWKGKYINIPSNGFVKLFLSYTPIILFALYILFYGKYWNINEFKIK